MAVNEYGEEFVEVPLQVDPSGWDDYQPEKGGLRIGQKEAAEAVAGYEFEPDYNAQRDARYQAGATAGLSREITSTKPKASSKPTAMSAALEIVNPDGTYLPGGSPDGLLPSDRMDASRVARGEPLLDRNRRGATYAALDKKGVQALSRHQDQGMKAFQQRNFLAQRARQRGLSSYSATEAPPEQEY